MQVMWMRVPGSNKRTARFSGIIALIWLVLASHPSWGADPKKKAGEGKAGAPAVVEPQVSEVAFIGKFSCLLKRQVVLPFKGIITSLKVRVGQQVNAGDVLATYHLAPEVALQLQRRLSPPQIKDLEMRLAEVDRALTQAAAKRREIQQLAAKKLAPDQTLAQADKEWQLLNKQRQAVQKNLQQEQELASEDLQVLKEQLGDSLHSRQLLKDGNLKAPIRGYVLFVHPELRDGAELDANTVAFQVGVMDPMVVKAQVHEMESLHLGVGDLAEISPESLPGRKFEARLSRLSWLPLKPGLEQPSYYEAEFQVPNPDLTLKEGMKVRIVVRKPK